SGVTGRYTQPGGRWRSPRATPQRLWAVRHETASGFASAPLTIAPSSPGPREGVAWATSPTPNCSGCSPRTPARSRRRAHSEGRAAVVIPIRRRASRARILRHLAGPMLLLAAVSGCERGAMEIVREIEAARGDCDAEALRRSDESCVRMMEQYAGMGTE